MVIVRFEVQNLRLWGSFKNLDWEEKKIGLKWISICFFSCVQELIRCDSEQVRFRKHPYCVQLELHLDQFVFCEFFPFLCVFHTWYFLWAWVCCCDNERFHCRQGFHSHQAFVNPLLEHLLVRSIQHALMDCFWKFQVTWFCVSSTHYSIRSNNNFRFGMFFLCPMQQHTF
jgi:hypothetical protein